MLTRLRNRLRELTPAEFRRMEAEAVTVTAQLAEDFQDNVRRSLQTIDVLMAHPAYADPQWRRQLFMLSHDMRGLGGSFNYQLITVICDSLCALLREEELATERLRQRYLAAHVAALQAILQFDLKGDGGDQGQRLLATIRLPEAAPGPQQEVP